MPRGVVHTLIGLLTGDGTEFALDVDGGVRWRTDVSDHRAAAELLDRRVTVIGRRTDFDVYAIRFSSLCSPITIVRRRSPLPGGHSERRISGRSHRRRSLRK